jgi:hypothetical protein
MAALASSTLLAQEAAAPIPGAEPSIRDRARTVIESDKEFLREVESGGIPDAPAATPAPRVKPPSPAPPPIASKTETTRERPRTAEPRRVPSAPAVSASESAPQRPPAPETRRASASSGLSRGDVVRFVQDFIEASEGPTPEGELALYAPRVRYFDSGPLTHEAIAKDQRRYYQRWPHREFTLVGEPEIVREDAESVTVRYRLRYRLRHGDESSSGQTEHILTLQKGEDGLKIAGIRERKVE